MKTLQLLTLSALAVFAPTKTILLTVLLLIFSDFCIGVLAAKKNKIPITSYKLKRTILKVFVYEFAILMSFLVGEYLTGPEVPVMKFLTTLIGLTELKSILENLDIASNGNFFSSVVDKIQSIMGAPKS